MSLPVLAGIAVVAAALLVAILLLHRRRNDPSQREQRRRLRVARHGRIVSAFVEDTENGFLFYRYTISGVEYTASQEVASLRPLLPDEPERLLGPAWIRYLPENPANSVLVSEEWSGLRSQAAPPYAEERQGEPIPHEHS